MAFTPLRYVKATAALSVSTMSRPSNQEIEHYYFEQFRQQFPLPEGDIEYSDRPDVIIHGEQKLGIEIANLYLSGDSKSIELTISFDPLVPIKDKKSISSAIADLARSIDTLPDGPVGQRRFEHIPELKYVYKNTIERKPLVWRVSQVYVGSILSLPRVEEIVSNKNQKMAQYQICDSYWLLLVVDFADRAQDQEISWPDGSAPVASKFDRIIIYKPQFAMWTDVPISKFC